MTENNSLDGRAYRRVLLGRHAALVQELGDLDKALSHRVTQIDEDAERVVLRDDPANSGTYREPFLGFVPHIEPLARGRRQGRSN